MINELRSKLKNRYDEAIVRSLFFLNDEESFSLFIDEVKKEKKRQGRYFTSEETIEAIGRFVCGDYSESISVLVDMVIESNPDVSKNAAHALMDVIIRAKDVNELLPIVKLLNYYEQISYASSFDRSAMGFNILANCKTPVVKSFIVNYSKGEYSSKDEVSFLDLARILPNIDIESELVDQLILHVKSCTHSYTIETIFKYLQNIKIELESQSCMILIGLIENDLKFVDETDKNKVFQYAFTTLGNQCNEEVFSFLIKSLDHDLLKRFVPYAFKKIQEKDQEYNK